MNTSKRVINVTSLYHLVERAEEVDAWVIVDEAENLYKSIKILGVKNTDCFYDDENRERNYIKATELSPLLRELAIQVSRRMNRWDDLSSGRMETHYGLPETAYTILYPYHIMMMKDWKYAYVTIDELISSFLKYRKLELKK